MATDERGTKRQCLQCGMKYYDLNRDPILCPGCQEPYVEPAEPTPRKSRPKDAETEVVAPAPAADQVEVDPAAVEAGAEVVAFQDAEETEADEVGKDIPDVDGVEDIGGEVDNAFIETDDEDDEEIDFVVAPPKDDE